jgi:hypothetical protein
MAYTGREICSPANEERAVLLAALSALDELASQLPDDSEWRGAFAHCRKHLAAGVPVRMRRIAVFESFTGV